jgi:selenocysteine lyase/cysteine desulfurase
MALNHFLRKYQSILTSVPRIHRTCWTNQSYVARPGGKFLNPLPPNSKSAYITNFEFVGTIDNAPYLCIPTALKYREQIGGEAAILEYCHTLARLAAKTVSEALGGTEILENEEGTLGKCCMSNVKLPLQLAEVVDIAKSEDVGMRILNWITSLLVREYSTFMAIMWYDNAWWVRLSAQVYLEMEDFEWAAKVLAEICGRVMKGEFLEE